MPKFSMLVVLGLLVVTTACEKPKAEATAASPSVAVVGSATSTGAILSANNSSTKVARIAFVGKEHACDCTRKKVDTALAALQKTLGDPATVPVEMWMADTQEDKVAPYRLMRPMLALPAIYFIDSKGGLVDMLQGEITEIQIASILKK